MVLHLLIKQDGKFMRFFSGHNIKVICGMGLLSILLAPGAFAASILSINGKLTSGQSLLSVDQDWKAQMQTDGNFVLKRTYDSKAIFSTHTGGNSGSEIRMQSDGNLVVYAPNGGGALWASNTGGNPGADLRMQTDGNLVIYSNGVALWSSGTSTSPIPSPDPVTDSALRNCIQTNKASSSVYDFEVTSLSCVSKGIDDLTGIGSLENLKLLYVGNNNITELAPVSSNLKLEKLYIANASNSNSFDDSDFSDIKNLSSLWYINLDANLSNNILYGTGFLSGFSSLTLVDINGAQFPCDLITNLAARNISYTYPPVGWSCL
ncbi:MAG: hypothetical protein ACI9CO_001212 [Candidatus Azotimanducaceae bacterium]